MNLISLLSVFGKLFTSIMDNVRDRKIELLGKLKEKKRVSVYAA